MTFLLRTWATFAIAIRRIIAQRGLALATMLGLVASIAMIMSVPIYSDAVYYRILQEKLAGADAGSNFKRPPFAFMWRYAGSLHGLKQLEEVKAIDDFMSGPAILNLNLPVSMTVRYAKTDNFRLFPAGGSYSDNRDPLEWVNFGFISDLEQHINLIEGQMPAVASTNPDEPVEVMFSKSLADALGSQVGEEYMTFREQKTETGTRIAQIPIHVSGIWTPKDPADPYWFYRLDVFNKHLMIPEASYQGRISGVLNDEVAQILWYWIMDGSNIHASDADWLTARIEGLQQQASALLSNTRLEISPYDALHEYQVASRLLNILLYAFSIPIVSLLLAFIGLVVGLAVGRQRNEIAVLRSRGATALQIVGVAVLEAILLGSLALAVGLPTSEWISQTIGATKSFLNFTLDSNLRVVITSTAIRFGLGALAVTLLAQVLPSFGASKHTIVSYKQEVARNIRPPWWQRAWLDLLLLIPAGYGAYLLQEQGSIVMPGSLGSGGLFDNPLLFLIPAIGALALTLLIIRLLPLFMTLLAWLAARSGSVGFLLATRYLSRDPAFYTTPLILLILTLSLSAFTASLAQTLDNHMFDKNYYSVGADVRLVELGTMNDLSSAFGGAGATGDTTASSSSSSGSASSTATPEPSWVFIPVSEHLKVKEIQAATRVGDFTASLQLGDSWKNAVLMGIDRVDFPKAAYWRRDFAPASLGALMNTLAIADDGLLMERTVMAQNGLRVGDSVPVRITTADGRAEVLMKIVGEIDYFPRWYASESEGAPLLVGNLEYIFEQVGGEQPYDVWVHTAPGTDYAKMIEDLRKYEITVFDYDVATQKIADEQRLPERQGLFGVLSVGFLASAFLTVLGFFLYALFSFRRRFIELGTLRAVGLSAGQLTVFLTCELAFLILLGLGAGTWLGSIISQVFIPSLQIGAKAAEVTPPFTVDMAWPAITRIYMLFIGLFIAALTVLVVSLLRMKIFQAIKLGETV